MPYKLERKCDLKTLETGLTSAEALRRLEDSGSNEPAPKHQTGNLTQLARLFANPLILILVAASIVSILVGDLINASLVLTIVFLGLIINFVQTYRSQRAVEGLRKAVAPTATVLRDGRWQELPRQNVVPGDIVRLSAGDLIPADGYLVEARDLHVQQAALTGESLPVEKTAFSGIEPPGDDSSPDRSSVFLGSSIVSGIGKFFVVTTGQQTQFGQIASRLATRSPETEFDRGTRRFGIFILETVFVLVIVVFLANSLRHRDLVESLLFAIALAVGLTPEFLPMIVAVTLSKGAVKMAKQGVIVKNLAAMQNFGSIDILCSDKTGTLTTGQMTLYASIDIHGKESERVFSFAYLNSFFETGIKSPLDQAIQAHKKMPTDTYQKVDEVPFDFERRRLSVVVKEGESISLITKGALEGILPICKSYLSNGTVMPLNPDILSEVKSTYEKICNEGLRALAVAYQIPTHPGPFTSNDEKNLILVGFLTFSDPPIPEAAEVLRKLHQDGVEIKILTGDNDLVARSICSRVGLEGKKVVLGTEIDRMSDVALTHVAESARIFARVSPAQKNRIILALKARGHVVGFLGDGINDAPSLHTADVGISVSTAVDVAKEAADIILTKRDLHVLHNGIVEGRQAFGNVMKYLLMGTSSNFGNMFSMAAASLFLPFLPMLPAQILLNNFLYDLAQITIPTDRVDPTFIRKPKKWDISLIRRFMVFIGPISSLYDFLTFFVLLSLFKAGPSLFQTGWFVESLITQTLVVFVIRTAGSPLKSLPSRPLTLTVLSVVTVGMLLPYLPFSSRLGFIPLPAIFYGFLLITTTTYLLIVDWVKQRIMGKLDQSPKRRRPI